MAYPLPMSGAFLGSLDNPNPSPPYWKTVLRPTPSSFTVSIYPPRKEGSNYHYGMRIIPSETPESPAQSNVSFAWSTRSSKYKEYDIFRRWDDCLDFQRTLEFEYMVISRRRRKGKPAFNHHSQTALYPAPAQRAASFDSLPLGPDPSSIASRVHVYIPKLSKKSTLFRPDDATIMRRGEEFKAMIEALLKEDAHSTIQELRTVQSVRDFFGFWRRDKEVERRRSKTVSNPSRRNSFATSYTSNSDEQTLSQVLSSSFSVTSFASAAETFPDTGPSSYFQSAPARFPRSRSVPRATPNGAVETHQLPALDASSRGEEPLAFLAGPHEESAPRRPPIRKGSTPEFSRLPPERWLDRDVSPPTRNIPWAEISADDYYPIPTPISSRQDASQRGGSRKATLTETLEEPTPINFPVDHPPDSPATPGVRARGRRFDSLAVLDPELYRSLSAQQALPWTNTPSNAAQVIARAPKSPLISDSAKRSARFFNDPNHGADLVDIPAAPPPRSPISSTHLSVRPDFPWVPASNENGEQFDQNFVQRKDLWYAQSPLGRLVIPEPHTHRKSEPVSANSVVSGNSTIPTPPSPRGTSLWASQPSPISPPGVYKQRHESTHPNELDSMPTTPITPGFNSSHAAADYNAGMVQIKAIHTESDIIVLFTAPRVEMTLADLRTELRRKLREAGGPKLGHFLLKYLPPRSDSGTTASTGALKRSPSASSMIHTSMVDLDNEIEWKKALESSTKIIMRIV